MSSPSPLLPEFFALLGIDLFLVLSLLACLLEDRFPKMLPFVYQVAALAGFGNLLIGRDFLTVFGEYMRFWYCFIYLIVALSNIIAVNVYLVALKGSLTIAKVWCGAVTFPCVLISLFFVSQYSLIQTGLFPLFLQISLIASAFVMGISISIVLSPQIANRIFRRTKEVT